MAHVPDTFGWRLAETIAWCTYDGTPTDPRRSLRTPTWQPPELGYLPQPPGYPNPTNPGTQIAPVLYEQAVVDALARARAEQLRRDGRYPLCPATDLAGGRLLLYAPADNLFDGAAELETHRFFDVDNVPAWDTWVWYDDGEPAGPTAERLPPSYLISWIPSVFLELVAAGIAVNPEACIRWAEDVDIRFTRELRASGFLTASKSDPA